MFVGSVKFVLLGQAEEFPFMEIGDVMIHQVR